MMDRIRWSGRGRKVKILLLGDERVGEARKDKNGRWRAVVRGQRIDPPEGFRTLRKDVVAAAQQHIAILALPPTPSVPQETDSPAESHSQPGLTFKMRIAGLYDVWIDGEDCGAASEPSEARRRGELWYGKLRGESVGTGGYRVLGLRRRRGRRRGESLRSAFLRALRAQRAEAQEPQGNRQVTRRTPPRPRVRAFGTPPPAQKAMWTTILKGWATEFDRFVQMYPEEKPPHCAGEGACMALLAESIRRADGFAYSEWRGVDLWGRLNESTFLIEGKYEKKSRTACFTTVEKRLKKAAQQAKGYGREVFISRPDVMIAVYFTSPQLFAHDEASLAEAIRSVKDEEARLGRRAGLRLDHYPFDFASLDQFESYEERPGATAFLEFL
jgi:hypothetical protein